MKTLIVFFLSLVLGANVSLAQGLSVPSTVETNEVFTMTGTSESNSRYITGVSYNPVFVETIEPGPNLGVFVRLQNVHVTSSYSIVTGSATEVEATAVNTYHEDIKVKFEMLLTIYDAVLNQTTYNNKRYITLTIKADDTPIVYSNTAKSRVFTKNNCTGNLMVGTEVTYTVPAGQFTSTISQADADAQATAHVNANGQAYANANGSCVVADLADYSRIEGQSVLNPLMDEFPRYNVVCWGPFEGMEVGTTPAWNVSGTGLSISFIKGQYLYLHKPTSGFSSGTISATFSIAGQTATVTKNVTLGNIN